MVPQLGLSRNLAGARPGRLALAGAAVLAAGLVVATTGGAALVLVGAVVAGAGFTYLSGLPHSVEERLAYGALAGSVAIALLGFLLGLVAGLTAATVLLALGLALLLSVPGWLRGRERLGAELAEAGERWARREPWPLWLLLAVSWPFTLALLGRAYRFTEQGLLAGNPGAYADWAAHLAYAGSFAYGANFPPQFPIDPGHRLAYPFLVDYLAAMLVPLGTSLTSALVLTSGLLALAFPAVMYLAGTRLLGSRGGAALAVPVFALGGGLGFLAFFQDLARLGPGVLQHLPRLYTQDLSQNYQWLSPVLAWMVPQRSTLLGFGLVLPVMAVLWQGLHLESRRWAPFAFAGTLAGLAPLCHLHAWGTVVALAAFWAVVSPRREWAAFFAPALVLGLPVVAWMLAGGAASIRTQVWWLANSDGHHDGPIWFWLKNTGLLIPAMAWAFSWRGLLPRRLALHLAPIWLWFLVPNFLVFQPWDWDNTKFFAYWALFGALPVGALLARLLTSGAGDRLLAGVLAGVLMLAGALDLARTLDTSRSGAYFTDAGGVQVAGWVRTHTDPHAVFLAAPDHNEPVPTLGGRRVVAGYPGWLWTYGLSDWSTRTEDARRMLRGDPGTPELLRRYGVGYVVVGPEEVRLGARAAYWDRAAERVWSNGPYTVYRVR